MKTQTTSNTVNNGLANALDIPQGKSPLLNPQTLFYNVTPGLLTLNWTQLAYAYKSIGFMQTAINQIVDDAFRNDGLIINTQTLDTDEITELRRVLQEEGDIEAIKDCIRWGQLYGGGVCIACTDQKHELPLDETQLEGKKLTFLAADRWQCIANGISPEIAETFTLTDNLVSGFTGSGITIDSSRIGLFLGVKAPYLLRAMLQGWGLSIFEAIISPLTQYLKAMGVTLELLDEAKIDIIKIAELANVLSSEGGERKIRERLQIVTDNKNYRGSIAMDANDDYQQKQISFSGIPDMITQIQYLICAALKRPFSKIFGKGGSGLSEETSDLENYNSIVDAEIRTPATKLIKWVIKLRCWQLFGRELPDLIIDWKPLKVMSEKDEAEIQSKKLADYMQLVDRQIMTRRQCAEHLTEDGIILFSPEELNQIDDDFTPDEYDNAEDLLINEN